MRKIILITISIFVFNLALPTSSFAQGMMGKITGTNSDGHTAREEAEGKTVWEKLQARKLTCNDLSADNFETLGEYFMGQMMGSSHEAMNEMMVRMMGKVGEEQMHIAMGKRMSGCDPNAPMPQNMMNSGMMPMMMGGGMMGGNNWGFGAGWGWFSLIFIIFWLVWTILGIVGIVALIKWLTKNK